MVEDALREGATLRRAAKLVRETDGLGHGEVRLHIVQRRAHAGLLRDHAAASSRECRVDGPDRGLRTLDLDCGIFSPHVCALRWDAVTEEDRLLERRFGEEARRVDYAPHRLDELTGSAVNGVRVQLQER